MRRHPEVRLLAGASWGLFLMTTGCALVGGGRVEPRGSTPRPEREAEVERVTPEDPRTPVDPTLGKVYQGFLEIEGGEIPAAIQIIREGRRGLWGALQATNGIEAEGTGRLNGEALELELSYGGVCPGRLSLQGRWDQETETLSGSVQATDCTGSAAGTFRFSGS